MTALRVWGWKDWFIKCLAGWKDSFN